MATATTARNTVTREPVVGLRRTRAEVAEVTGSGHVRADGRKCWTCASSRNPNQHYIVILSTNGQSLWCSCQAGRFGKECRHKSAVAIRISRERAEADENMRAAWANLAESRARIEQLAEDDDDDDGETYWMTTPKGDAAIAAWRARQAAQASASPSRPATFGGGVSGTVWDPRESATPAQRPAFSVWK